VCDFPSRVARVKKHLIKASVFLNTLFTLGYIAFWLITGGYSEDGSGWFVLVFPIFWGGVISALWTFALFEPGKGKGRWKHVVLLVVRLVVFMSIPVQSGDLFDTERGIYIAFSIFITILLFSLSTALMLAMDVWQFATGKAKIFTKTALPWEEQWRNEQITRLTVVVMLKCLIATSSQEDFLGALLYLLFFSAILGFAIYKLEGKKLRLWCAAESVLVAAFVMSKLVVDYHSFWEGLASSIVMLLLIASGVAKYRIFIRNLKSKIEPDDETNLSS